MIWFPMLSSIMICTRSGYGSAPKVLGYCLKQCRSFSALSYYTLNDWMFYAIVAKVYIFISLFFILCFILNEKSVRLKKYI